ncbi:MAG: hypothetical protein GF390_04240 [Candidatus Pacebacteria bacterium]|nr:hypothetical protein [Candidatus Paceibacterota bacterium]
MTQRQIILASQSQQRKNILATLGLQFKVIPADLDEQAVQAKTEVQRAVKIAHAKAHIVSQQHPQAIVIAADTYCLLNNQALEKPQDLSEAQKMLQAMSGQEMRALTGFCYLDPQHHITYQQSIVTQFGFRWLTQAEIDYYVHRQPVLTWSAAFSPAYDAGTSLVAWSKGSLTSFTHGLPIEEVVKCLQKSQVLKINNSHH